MQFRALSNGSRDRVLLICGEAFTKADLDLAAETLADHMSAAGIGPHCRVALAFGNTPQFVASLLAAFRIEASAVLFSKHFTDREIVERVVQTGPVAILGPTDFGRRFERLYPALRIEPLVSPTRCGIVGIWCLPNARPTAISAERVVQFTSGAGGPSKAVPKTVANLENELENFASRLNLGVEDATVCAAPLSHAYGLVNGLLLPLFTGRTTVLMDWFLPNDAVDLIRHYRARVFAGVPVMYKAVAEAHGPTVADVASLRLCFSAGSPLSEGVFRAFKTRYRIPINQQYGTTETGTLAVNLLDGEQTNPLAVGRALGGREIQLIGDGRPAAPGECGEVTIRSGGTMAGYLGDETATAERLRDGWYWTGDLGYIDSGGDLVLQGRRSWMINVAGLKVDPAEVEDVIAAFDGVVECAVVPLLHEGSGSVVKAVVVVRQETSAEAIQRFCRNRLAAHKVPRQVVFVDALPRGATGKVLRKELVKAPHP